MAKPGNAADVPLWAKPRGAGLCAPGSALHLAHWQFTYLLGPTSLGAPCTRQRKDTGAIAAIVQTFLSRPTLATLDHLRDRSNAPFRVVPSPPIMDNLMRAFPDTGTNVTSASTVCQVAGKSDPNGSPWAHGDRTQSGSTQALRLLGGARIRTIHGQC